MKIIRDYYNAINDIAPFAIAGAWDNVGLLVGSPTDSVRKTLLALDATQEVIAEAEELGANLLIVHHPIIFSPLKSIASGDLVYQLASKGIGLLVAHTNLDMALGGVGDVFADVLELTHRNMLSPSENYPEKYGYSGMGELESPLRSIEFAKIVKKRLHAPGVRYIASDKPIKKVAYCGGSGGKFLFDAIAAGADAYVTGEIEHHLLLEAKKANIALVLAGHFHTETIVMEPLKRMLQARLPQVELLLSTCCTDHIEYL